MRLRNVFACLVIVFNLMAEPAITGVTSDANGTVVSNLVTS